MLSNVYWKLLIACLVLLILVLTPLCINLLDDTDHVTEITTVRGLIPTNEVTTFEWDFTSTEVKDTLVGTIETENNITITYVDHHRRLIENQTVGSVFMDDIYIRGQSVKSVLENLYGLKFGIGIGFD